MAQAQENTQILDTPSQEKKTFKDRLKLTLSGLSGAYMLPISTLILVAVFLSLGGFIESQFGQYSNGQVFGTLIKSMAYALLQAIPLLFCVAFTLSFCKGDQTCVWNAVIAYLIFLSVQGIFIKEHSGGGYTIMFNAPGRDATLMTSLVDRNLGFICMNTSIFGSFIIGGVMMPYIQRRWFNVQLKGPFAFFSGRRFVPLISVVGSTIIAIYFIIIWPWIGYGFSKLGEYLSKTPYGIDSFIFGLLEKSLIPTGLHHMFYAPLWFSPLGGDAVARVNAVNPSEINSTWQQLWHNVATLDRPGSAAGVLGSLKGKAYLPHAMWQGDSLLGLSIISMPSNRVGASGAEKPIFEYFKDTLGINVGRYTQGKYPIMQFCLPAAAIGMSLATNKPKETIKVFIPGILSSALLGITEPLEFTFLFAAPRLFYGFHAVMCGVSFMLMNIFGAHIPSILSGGVVEMILLGVIPMAKGTHWYAYFYVGGALAPIYLAVFYTAIKTGRLRVDGVNGESDGSAHDESEEVTSKVPAATRKLALALGGWENISKMSNCASRLRYDIVDKSKVNEAALKAAGVIAVKWVGDNHLQAIVGPKAEGINNEMLKWNGEKL